MSFIELVNIIRKRPGMYIGKIDLDRLYIYIAGIIVALESNKIDGAFLKMYNNYFNYYVQLKVIDKCCEDLKEKLHFNNGMSFVQLIPFCEKNPSNQINFYFECLDEFKKNVDENYNFESLKFLFENE